MLIVLGTFPVSIEISLVDRFTRNKVARYLSPCVKLGCRSDSRNEMLEKIREMIKQGYKMDQQALIPHLKKVNAFISQYQNGDKTNSTLLMNVEEKNQEFLQRLCRNTAKLVAS